MRILRKMPAILILLLLLPACRREEPPTLSLTATLAQVTETQLLPGGDLVLSSGQQALVGTAQVVLTFRFPEAMDRDSLLLALRTEPRVEQQISWPRDDLLQVRLTGLPAGTPVRVKLGKEARARSGARLAPWECALLRLEAPAVTATLEGQTEVRAPGKYSLLAGKKTLRLEFTHEMERTAVEKILLGQLPLSCHPTLRWENDRLAYLDLDLPAATSLTISFLGWPDRRGVPSLEANPLALRGAGTARLLAGSDLRQPLSLVTLLDQFEEGAVSPDGRKVALVESFPLEEGKEAAVWVLELGSKSLRRLGAFPDAGQFSLGWTPDSGHLVVNAGPEILLLPASGGEGRALAHLPHGVFVGMSVGPRSGRVACFAPARAEEGAQVDLLIIEPATGRIKNYPAVTHLLSSEGRWLPVPCAWAPEESAVAFCDFRTPEERILTLLDPEQGGTRELGGGACRLAWSPDARQLAVGNPDGSWDLLTVKPSTPTEKTRRPLLAGKREYFSAWWAPAGDRLLFGSPGPEKFLLIWKLGAGAEGETAGIPLGWVGDRALWIAP